MRHIAQILEGRIIRQIDLVFHIELEGLRAVRHVLASIHVTLHSMQRVAVKLSPDVFVASFLLSLVALMVVQQLVVVRSTVHDDSVH